ncbi:hypothetical protein [Sandaracinus amylolyticus]|uniref:hypothetical protein n=1 Tax=Sandaracinus amylolyticus TaxID=927083 RepID=UPI001F29365E|nr:hypothetical protein [Sandaracinus amylolyticus]UJR81660.1 Hypothetical protein I5071_37200 [Sandaracinus amylolyticus]
MIRGARALIAAAVISSAAACGGGAATASPEESLAAFARALREGDASRAYALTSEGYRRRVREEDFARWMRESPDEIRALAEALDRPAGPAEQEATVAIEGEDPVRFVRDPSGWRVASDVVDYYGQRTPRQALRSFVRAIARRRWDVVLRLVPAADAEGMSEDTLRARWEGESREEIERLAAGLRAALDGGAPIEERGDHAVMPWGERYRAQLVREDGVWKIEDPD